MIDTLELTRRIDLKALAEEAGAHFHHKNASHCPLHAGADNPRAFHVYQGQDGRWRWKCFTNCPEGADGGDAIAFYMQWQDVDFVTACRELAQRANLELDSQKKRAPAPAAFSPPPKPIVPPGDRWQSRARAFVDYAQAQLWTSSGRPVLDYLHRERGLTAGTLREWGLGYNPRDCWDPPQRWGLSGKRIWLPRGVVLPVQRDGALWNVKVRRPLPGDALARTIGFVSNLPALKFSGPRGGCAALFGADRLSGLPLLILAEGEFDALIAWQAVGDLADVASLGGVKHHLDGLDLASLTRAWCILAMYDLDEAGQAGNAYLQSVSRRFVAVPPPAQDLTAYWQANGQLRPWLAGVLRVHLECLLNGLDQRRHADLWVKWYALYNRVWAACQGEEKSKLEDTR